MQAGDLYVNPNGQRRLVLGFTPDGKVAYASAGQQGDYTSCVVQERDSFEAAVTFDHQVAVGELARVSTDNENWLEAKGVDGFYGVDKDGEPNDPDAELKAHIARTDNDQVG